MGIHSLSMKTRNRLVEQLAMTDIFAISDRQKITGRILREMIGAAFDPYAAMPTIQDVLNSPDAMNVVAASSVARNAIMKSNTAWSIASRSSMAIAKILVGAAGLNPANYPDMQAVATVSTPMQAIAASEEAVRALSMSPLALNVAVKNSTAGVALVNSPWLQQNIENIIASCNDITYFAKTPDVVSGQEKGFGTLYPRSERNHILILKSWYSSCYYYNPAVSVVAIHGYDNYSDLRDAKVVFGDTGFGGTRPARGVLIGGGRFYLWWSYCSQDHYVTFTFDDYRAR